MCVEPSKLNHTIWVTSVFFVLSVFNLVSIVLPLASEFVWLAYKIYLAIAMCHFVDLTMAWYGGETTMLSHVNNGEDEEKINFRWVLVLDDYQCWPGLRRAAAASAFPRGPPSARPGSGGILANTFTHLLILTALVLTQVLTHKF